MIHILNDKLSVRISEKGAELQSVQSNGIEYLWQADPAFWAKHSPVLFPFIGELKDGKYIFQGTEYKMPRHGFARDKVFATEQTSDASAIFILYSDKESVDMYPFTFIFKIEYKLGRKQG
jgi:galactose mutarotase-like enzyme